MIYNVLILLRGVHVLCRMLMSLKGIFVLCGIPIFLKGALMLYGVLISTKGAHVLCMKLISLKGNFVLCVTLKLLRDVDAHLLLILFGSNWVELLPSTYKPIFAITCDLARGDTFEDTRSHSMGMPTT